MRADRDRQGLALPDDDDEPLAPRHRGVDEVSREHRVMLGRDSDHHRGIFRALRLVDRRRICRNECVEFAKRILDFSPVKVGDEHAFGLVDALDAPERR